jgi:hypothetical protein
VTWFYVDDQLSDHKKVARIPRPARSSAMGLWLLAGSWAKRHKTDGWVPGHMVEELAGTEADAEALCVVKLWTRHKIDDEDGFVFVNWAEWQKTREQEEAKAAANAERQARYRKRHRKGGTSAGQESLFEEDDTVGNDVTDGVSDGVSDDVSNGVTNEDMHASVTTPPRTPRTPRTPLTEQTSSVPAHAAADAPADAAADGSLPGMPEPPPKVDRRTESQKLVDLWISELCQGKRPPNRTIGHLGRELSLLLNRDKIPVEDVEAGLRRWHDLRLGPSQLANVVHEVRIADTPRASAYTRQVNGLRPSHTDARVAAGMSLIEQLAAEEAAAGQAPREIGS